MRRHPTAASRQNRRLEPRDLVAALDLAFGPLPPGAPLWPASKETFRARFKMLGRTLEVPVDSHQRSPPGSKGRCSQVLDLGSLRAAGATDLYSLTQSLDTVQGRGGWTERKVLNTYIQEVVSSTFVSQLPTRTRTRVALFAKLSRPIWKQTMAWLEEGHSSERLRALWRARLLGPSD